MNPIEHASNERGRPSGSPFPTEWGPPPTGEAERRGWIALHARRAAWQRNQGQITRARQRLLELRREAP